MATGIYLKVKGAVAGDIAGGVEQKGHEDTTEVLSYSHGINTAVDATSGRSMGGRMHQPATVVCKVDKATPVYLNALTKNENLEEVTLEFYHMNNQTGAEELFYTILLEDGRFSDIQMSADGGGSFDTAVYAISYRKVTWTWADGNIETTDDWLERA